MSSTIRLIGWSPSLQKVSLTKLIRRVANLPLDSAHDAVNRLLEGKVVDIAVLSEDDSQQLADEMRALGAEAVCIEVPHSLPS